MFEKDFTGYTVCVKCNTTENINGKKVIKTIRWLSCGNPKSTLYEVKLDNGRYYQLYEDEMIKE